MQGGESLALGGIQVAQRSRLEPLALEAPEGGESLPELWAYSIVPGLLLVQSNGACSGHACHMAKNKMVATRPLGIKACKEKERP